MHIPFRPALSLSVLALFVGTLPALGEPTPTPTPAPDPYTVSMHRYAGADRYETALAISRQLYADHSQAQIFLASGERFPDAITAANAFAAPDPKPILLTPKDQLPEAVVAELKRLASEKATVTLIGGEQAIGAEVETQLNGLGLQVTRVSGEHRVDTALSVLKSVKTPRQGEYLVITPAEDFATSVIGAAHAIHLNAPHLYASQAPGVYAPLSTYIEETLPLKTITVGELTNPVPVERSLEQIKDDYYVDRQGTVCYPDVSCTSLGDMAPAADYPAQRIAEKLLATEYGKVEHLVVVAGDSPVDGIAATQLAAKYNAPIVPMYTRPEPKVGLTVLRYITILKTLGQANRQIHLVGGEQVLPKDWEDQIKLYLEDGLNAKPGEAPTPADQPPAVSTGSN